MEDTTTKSTVTKDETQTCHDALLNPPGYGWQPSVLYNQHFGLPPFLDFRDLSWMESIFKKLRTSSWPGYIQVSAFPSLKIQRDVGGGVSKVYAKQGRWTVSLDVNHFAPSEISVRTQSGFLLVEGKHEERQDEHGYISRCFLRKYKLPAGIQVESIRSFVTGDGVLTIEATLPYITPPADVTIPVQVEIEAPILEDRKQDGCQPGEPEIADTVIPPPPAEKPQDDAVGIDESMHHKNGLPDAPETVEGGEEAVTSQQDGERREEETVDVADSTEATDVVLDSKPEAPEAPDALEIETQRSKEDEEIKEPEPEGDLPSAEAEGEPPVSERTLEEIPSKLDVKEQAVEQMEQIK